MKTTRLWLALLLLPVPWSAAAQAATQSGQPARVAAQDGAISAIYVQQGKVAFAQKDWTTVSDLLRVALEFNPENSDALFLRGEMYQEMGGKIRGAISSYQAALNAQNWQDFTESGCRLKLAPLLIRTKQYAQALALLQGMGNAGADYLYYTAESFVGLGQEFQARNLLEQAAGAFPSDIRFPMLRLRFDTIFRRELANRFLAEPASSSISRRLLESLIVFTRNPAEKEKLVRLYEQRFAFSPAVFAQSLLAARSATPSDIAKYVSNSLLKDGKLTEHLYASLPSGPAKTALVDRIATYTGTVTLDTNGDGIAEETADYSGGLLSRLIVDSDQDGVPEYDIAFSGGVPKDLTLRQDGVAYSLTYGTYPFLASASLGVGSAETTYTLEPNRVSFPLFGASTSIPAGPGAFPPIVHAIGSITRNSLFAFSVRVQTTNPATKAPVSLWTKSINNILQLEQQWQGGRYNYKAVFHGGVKYSAEIDVDNDGFYEVHEYYRDGKLSKLAYYPSYTHVPEFTLVFEPYPVLSWDFNQDGLIDEVEKQVSPHTTILEFSTKMNGVFDVVTKEVTK